MIDTRLYRLKERFFEFFPIFRSFLGFGRFQRDKWIENEAQKIPAEAKVLDVGAGPGPYRAYFSHCDYKTQDLGKSKLRGGLDFIHLDLISDVNALPLVGNSFDVILCTEVIEHVPEPIIVIGELFRVLKHGGILLLTAPLSSGIHQAPLHYYSGYTRYWYEKYLQEIGFSDIDINPIGGFFRFFGQESIRFLVFLSPFSSIMSIWKRALIFPLWLLFTPWLGIFFPLICQLLDVLIPIDSFTLGYRVKAIK